MVSHKFIFSIGYEEIEINEYIRMLKKNSVRIVFDVRNERTSKNENFKKSSLKDCLTKNGIEYRNATRLSIDYEKIKAIKTKKDKRELFKQYKKELQGKEKYVRMLKAALTTKRRIAITGFEKKHTECHRSILINHYCKNFEKVSVIYLRESIIL